MEKRLREILLEVDSLILDTPFILPYIGIKVKELDRSILTLLEDIKLYYPYVLIPELIGVVFKVSRRMGLKEIPDEALTRFNYIVYGEHIHLITPESDDIKTAYNLIKIGLNDLFDALLYSTSIRTDMKLITMDRELIEFLKRRGLETKNIILI